MFCSIKVAHKIGLADRAVGCDTSVIYLSTMFHEFPAPHESANNFVHPIAPIGVSFHPAIIVSIGARPFHYRRRAARRAVTLGGGSNPISDLESAPPYNARQIVPAETSDILRGLVDGSNPSL